MKAVFDTRADSGYDDDAPERYHFPGRYLEAAKRALGDWFIYRAPRRGGGQTGYFAVARLDRIEPDKVMQNHYFVTISNYFPFDEVVPLRHEGGMFEQQFELVGSPLRLGAAMQGKSIRTISEIEFGVIVRAGLDETLLPANGIRLSLEPKQVEPELAAFLTAPLHEQQRKIMQILVNRKVRDAAFRRAVCDAYDNRCAVTGIQMINGGGRAEAQAAHIWSVASGGPDVVQNGVALCATAHWAFDRHLISLTDDYALLVSHNRVPEELRNLFKNQLNQIHLPADKHLRPHPAYIRRHREAFLQ